MSASRVALSVGGAPREAARTFERRNPVTGEMATIAAAASPQDALAAVAAAQAAFPAWSAQGPNARRALLTKAAAAMEARADAFVDAMMAEIGATEGWARFNLMLAASMIREAAGLTTQISGEVIPSDKPGCISMSVREPAGVVLSMAPWNAPNILATRALAVSTDAQTGTPNAVVQFSGALDGTRLTIDNGTNAGVATFGAIVQMPLGPSETRVSTFSLYVDGRMMASKDIPYRVAHR